MTADEDSIQIVVFYQYVDVLAPFPDTPVHAIEWRVDYGDANVAGQTHVAVSEDDYVEVI